MNQILGMNLIDAEEPATRCNFGFFIDFTGIFPLLRDNPVIQYFWFEHERYRAV